MSAEARGRAPAGEAAPARPAVHPALTRLPRHLLAVCVEAKCQPTNQPINWEFPGGPVSGLGAFSAAALGVLPGWAAKISQAVRLDRGSWQRAR